MQHTEPRDRPHANHLVTSVVLAVVGGFLDAFTYIGHGHVFANAQTGNVVLLGIGMTMGSRGSLRHLPPIIAFVLGIAAARSLLRPAIAQRIAYFYTFVLAIEAAVFAVIGALPRTASNLWITIVIAFTASIQVEIFNEVNGARYNSTFTTGNLRTLSESVHDWLHGDHSSEKQERIRDFAGICMAFLVGAILGGVTTTRWNNHALWCELLLLVPLMLFFQRKPVGDVV